MSYQAGTTYMIAVEAPPQDAFWASLQSGLTKLDFGVLAFNSALAIYNSWGDAGSVTFALAADAALVLLFLCLRAFEQGGGRGRDARIKDALFKMGLGVVACDAALAHHHAHGDAGSLAFVCVTYVAFVTLTWLFLRRFDGRAGPVGSTY